MLCGALQAIFNLYTRINCNKTGLQEQQLGVLRSGNYVHDGFWWICQARCTNYGWLSTKLVDGNDTPRYTITRE